MRWRFFFLSFVLFLLLLCVPFHAALLLLLLLLFFAHNMSVSVSDYAWIVHALFTSIRSFVCYKTCNLYASHKHSNYNTNAFVCAYKKEMKCNVVYLPVSMGTQQRVQCAYVDMCVCVHLEYHFSFVST